MKALRNCLEWLAMWADFLRGMPVEWAEDEAPLLPLSVEALLFAIAFVSAVVLSFFAPGPWFGG